jgi:Repeat of unknown function (DUF5648)
MSVFRRAVIGLLAVLVCAVVSVQAHATASRHAVSPRVDAAAAEDQVVDPVPLLELRTNGNVGWFWTSSEAEAAAAVSQNKMTLQSSKLGYLRRQAFTGSQPIYRLASLTMASYLLTASASERDALTTGPNPAFRYEGVIGYAFATRPVRSTSAPSTPTATST